jgi:hypothetical protein
MKQRCLLAILALLLTSLARAQSTAHQLNPILEKELQPPQVVVFQLQEYLMRQVPKLPPISTPEKWTAEGERIRKRVLANVVFHGWPKEWVTSPPHFEDMGALPSGKGYRLRKLRYDGKSSGQDAGGAKRDGASWPDRQGGAVSAKTVHQ